MAQKLQTALGGATTVSAGGTAEIAHRSSGGEWINLVAYASDGAGVNMNAYVDPEDGNKIPLLTRADDGPDTPQGGDYPIPVPTGDGGRFLPLIRLDRGDELVFELENTSASSRTVTTVASAAGTIDVALGNRGGA